MIQNQHNRTQTRPLRRSPQMAFTLIELLVVISIISLLVSILLPALASARKNAQAIACLSNQRQLYLAQRMYADAYNGYFAQAKMTSNGYNATSTKRSIWSFLTSEFIDGSHNELYYDDLPEVYRCTTWPRAWYDLDHSRMGIGMNATPMRPDSTASVFSSSWKLPDDSIQAFRFDDVLRQSEKMMIGDSSTYFVMPKYISASVFEWQLNPQTPTKPWPYISSDPTRHLDTANYMMFDGHGGRLNYEQAIYAIVFK
ncbi:MAG TPA: hypothetical protein DCM28_05380 [Phycisphaerales bacterium]|nr:hypothetical protein [Phycisphaerales bacterium]HCD33455.1 hypothetical protein [Phycisphaerales bacterium]